MPKSEKVQSLTMSVAEHKKNGGGTKRFVMLQCGGGSQVMLSVAAALDVAADLRRFAKLLDTELSIAEIAVKESKRAVGHTTTHLDRARAA